MSYKNWDERFWAKVNICGKYDCWEWKGSSGGSGYGHFWKDGITIDAHRLAYKIAYGPIEDGKHILHKCSNKKCVNPLHLYMGDQIDNMIDAKASGNSPGRPKKLHPGEEWLVVKLYFSKRLLNRQIAKMFRISQYIVYQIVERYRLENIVPPILRGGRNLINLNF